MEVEEIWTSKRIYLVEATFVGLGPKCPGATTSKVAMLEGLRVWLMGHCYAGPEWLNPVKGFTDLDLNEGDRFSFRARIKWWRQHERGANGFGFLSYCSRYVSPMDFAVVERAQPGKRIEVPHVSETLVPVLGETRD